VSLILTASAFPYPKVIWGQKCSKADFSLNVLTHARLDWAMGPLPTNMVSVTSMINADAEVAQVVFDDVAWDLWGNGL